MMRQLLGVPVFAVVDRSGNPYIFSEQKVLVPEYKDGAPNNRECSVKDCKGAGKRGWSFFRFKSRPTPGRPLTVQRGLLFFNADDAATYMNQLVKTSRESASFHLFFTLKFPTPLSMLRWGTVL